MTAGPRNDGAMALDTMQHLYGRDEELKTLHEAYSRKDGNAATKIFLVHGSSGAGKTALLSEFASSLDVYVLQGKYDQYAGVTSPFSAIVSAFDQLGNGSLQPEHQECMKKCLTFEASLLTKLIPSFSKFASDRMTSTETPAGKASLVLASERLAVAFSSFLREFCNKCQPIVLFMDDLQWMDKHSCDLLSRILNDKDIQHLVFLGGFRDDKESLIQPFLDVFPKPTVDIQLENLNSQAVNELLEGLLRCSQKDAKSLGTIVYRKTAGNPYFVMQQLQMLYSQHLVKYNFAGNKWEWNLGDVTGATDLSENVVDMVSSRLRTLPSNVRRLLKLAACLGFFVELDALRLVDSMYDCEDGNESTPNEETKEAYSTDSFEDALSTAIEEALVECSGTVLKFSHDRIQQCVYELIGDETAQNMLHYKIGENFKTMYKETSNDQYLLLAVHQLNRSSSLIESDEERLSLIELNSQAASVAKESADIENVASMLRKATELAKPSFWRFYYDLMLDIFNLAAEVEFSMGHTEVSDELINVILENAACEQDTIRALVITFQTLGHQRKFGDAIKQGRRILELVGEPLPPATLPNVLLEYWRARRDTKNKTDDFFLNLSPTSSENIKIAMKVLEIGSVYGWNADTTFAGLAFLRAMRITVREGSFMGTPYIYSGFALMLTELSGSEGIRFAQLARSKGEREKESLPGSCPLSYMNVLHWTKPICIALEPLLSGYRTGLEIGDLFFGSICISCYALVYFSCGLPLGPNAVDLHCFGSQLRICRQDVALAFIAPSYQFALNLLGESSDPVEISRESIAHHQADIIPDDLLEDETDASFLFMLYLQVFNAYILGELDTVETTMKRISKLPARRVGGTHILNYFFPLVDGLVGFALVKANRSRKASMGLAKRAIAELSKVAKTRPVNSISSLKLLRAEQAATLSQPFEKVKTQFDEVIRQFSRSGHIHYNAIANELAGKFMLTNNDQGRADHYLSRACFLYSDWNAAVKAEQLLKQYPFVQNPQENATSVLRSSIQGKSRFDESRDSLKTSRRERYTENNSSTDFSIG